MDGDISIMAQEVNCELRMGARLCTAVGRVATKHGLKPGTLDQRLRRAGYRYCEQKTGELVRAA